MGRRKVSQIFVFTKTLVRPFVHCEVNNLHKHIIRIFKDTVKAERIGSPRKK